MRRLSTALVLILALAACDGPQPEEETLPTRTRADVEAAVSAQADAIAATADAPLTGWRTTAAPCTGADDGRWRLSGFANLAVPPEHQVAALGGVRDAWRQSGYEITEDRVFADGTRAAVGMRDQISGFTVSLTTVPSLDSAALIVTSSCHLPAEGEDPAGQG